MKRVLIVCSHFWPSLGGLEVSMGQLSRELVTAGYELTVLTLSHPNRHANEHQGVHIHSADAAVFSAEIRTQILSGAYDVAILVQDPLGHIIWSLEGCMPPPQTRVIIQPIINQDGYNRWKDNTEFCDRLARILKDTADVVVTMTQRGPDSVFMQQAGIPSVFIPNAADLIQPHSDFRTHFGISPDRFVILHVANLYWVKNHIGLMDALTDLPDSWQLVMIGNANIGSDCANAVTAKLHTRPDVVFIPGLPPQWIAAAMDAANVVVLASHGEGSPITILEAMSHRKPWIVTPQCGAATEHLGGLVCELPDFKGSLRVLADNPSIQKSLADISYSQWETCHSWPVVLQAWIDLIEQGHIQRHFDPSSTWVAAMANVKMAIAKEMEVPAEYLNPLHGDMDQRPVAPELPPPDKPDLIELINAAEGLMQDAQHERAINLYRAWIQHSDSPLRYAATFNLGVILENLGRFTEAEQAYRRCITSNPNFAAAHYRLAIQLQRRSALQEARAHLVWITLPDNGVASKDPTLFSAAQSHLQS